MKQPLLIFCFSLLIISCSGGGKVDHGTIETDALSRKLLDALRTNDEDKFKELLPDKATFRRLTELNDPAATDVNTKYKQMIESSLEEFRNVHSNIADWSNAVFLNTSQQPVQTDNMNIVNVTAKFKVTESVYKMSFRAQKMEGRWYYTGEFSLTVKDQKTSADSSAAK